MEKNKTIINLYQVESSSINAFGYDQDNNLMYIKFRGGSLYEYRNVTRKHFDLFVKEADRRDKGVYGASVGKLFWRTMRKKAYLYPYRKISYADLFRLGFKYSPRVLKRSIEEDIEIIEEAILDVLMRVYEEERYLGAKKISSETGICRGRWTVDMLSDAVVAGFLNKLQEEKRVCRGKQKFGRGGWGLTDLEYQTRSKKRFFENSSEN
ncbi:MAG: KTSC domain-containing protein [Cytophagales bacterium]|nr:KTSC domain-containing protein [Cytophagales bacterium]